MGKRKSRSARNKVALQEKNRPGSDKSGPGSAFVGRMVHRSMRFTTGPIPSARQLMEYESILPGSASRIFDEFQAQGKHRRVMEKFVVIGGVFAQFGGLISATLLSYFIVKAGIDLLLAGRSIVGLGTLTGALAGLVTALYVGRKQNTKSLVEKITAEVWEAFSKRNQVPEIRHADGEVLDGEFEPVSEPDTEAEDPSRTTLQEPPSVV